jgi:hypothetical protein
MVVAEGMGGGGGAPVGWIVFSLLVGAAVVALMVRRTRVHAAHARVASRVQPDPGLVTLHDLPAPGSLPTMAVGVAVAHDRVGELTLLEPG